MFKKVKLNTKQSLERMDLKSGKKPVTIVSRIYYKFDYFIFFICKLNLFSFMNSFIMLDRKI